MRHPSYYVIAALPVLATIPMYRYILTRAMEEQSPLSHQASKAT